MLNQTRASILLSLSLLSCKDEPLVPPLPPPGPSVAHAVYVLNEGNYGDPAGARLSVYDLDRDTVFTDIVESANGGLHLGSTGDDIAVHRNTAYIVMSGSEELKVLRLPDHTVLRTVALPGSTPHDIAIDSTGNRLFITRLFSASILVLDLATCAVLDTIPVGDNPQGMAVVNNLLFVCNSGYGVSNTVSVINPSTSGVVTALRVGDGPTGAVLGADGNLWIACTGNAYAAVPTTGRLVSIDPATLRVRDSVVFEERLFGPIAADAAGFLYVLGVTPGSYYGGAVHRVAAGTGGVVTAYIPGTFYGIGVESGSGDVYVTDAREFAADGVLHRYGSDGVLKRTVTVERGPAAMQFRR